MEQSGLPPVIPDSEPVRNTVPRWRWWIHLLILTAYPISLGVLSATMRTDHGPLLRANPVELAVGIFSELALFAFIFGLAWLASRANARELRLQWSSGLAAITRGFLYSIALRLGIMLVMVVVLAILYVAAGYSPEDIKKLSPEYENLIDSKALVSSPLYFWLNFTVVSFVLGGFREELWRAGMLAGMAGVAPKVFSSIPGQIAAVCVASISFGLGHLTQGWGGVVQTTFLGVGLGLIIVWHRTIWTAVFAHGFFNATSFLMIYILTKLNPDLLHRLAR